LSLEINTNGVQSVTTLFSNLQIQAAGLTYSANNICTDDTSTGCVGTNGTPNAAVIVFTNLSVPLAADTYIPVKVLANVAVDTNNTLDGTIASTTWSVSGINGGTSNNPDVEDQSFNTLAVNTANFTANNLTFTGSSVSVSGLAINKQAASVIQATGNSTEQFSFTFSLTAGNNPIYVSSTAATALGTSAAPAGFTITSSRFSDSDTSGDGSRYFYFAPGQTKTLTAVYSASASSSASGNFQVNSINYGTTTSATGGVLNQTAIPNTLYVVLF
jgi:hypothetical protein